MSQAHETGIEATAFTAKTGAGVKIVGFQGAGRGRPTCDHRGNIGHLESSCWELHGVLDWAEQRGRKGASNPTPVGQFRGATGRQSC